MKYLVTGGAGFIGSHLCDELLRRGHSVVALDDLSTGRETNLRGVAIHPRFRFVVGSVLDAATVSSLVSEVDAVFHLAAVVGVRRVLESTVDTFRTNVIGTMNVLASAQPDRKPVLVASSSEVYGSHAPLPFDEESDLRLSAPTTSRWSYAVSKLADEYLAIGHARERGVPTIVARLFNTTGPRQRGRYGMVLPTFVGQALAEKPLTVFGDGTQRRAFTHVRETTRALADLVSHASSDGTIVNVGGDQEISILDLAERVRRITRSHSPIVKVPYREAYGADFEDIARRVPSLTRLQTLIGWRPTCTIDEIVSDLVQARRLDDASICLPAV